MSLCIHTHLAMLAQAGLELLNSIFQFSALQAAMTSTVCVTKFGPKRVFLTVIPEKPGVLFVVLASHLFLKFYFIFIFFFDMGFLVAQAVPEPTV